MWGITSFFRCVVCIFIFWEAFYILRTWGSDSQTTVLLSISKIVYEALNSIRVDNKSYLNIRMSWIWGSKLSAASFFFVVWVKLWFSDDSNVFSFIFQCERLARSQLLFVWRLNGQHQRYGLIDHSSCGETWNNVFMDMSSIESIGHETLYKA